MSGNQSKLLLLLLFIAMLMSGTWFVTYEYCSRKFAPTDIVVKTDTLRVTDTITLSKPIFVNKIKRDSVLVPVTDTIKVNDTIYVSLQRESIEWRDSLSSVYASGVMVNVDSVRHYVTTTYIDREVRIPVVKRTHWGLGVQVGYGAGVAQGKVVGVPYVGVGVSYNLLSW